ncbi:histidine kinase dimerization/phospho-acceptor domain-containing protein [Variovorax sp. JS1663]|uniref:histidine kinase dimerization/phospho-acceptor domain-containing protein n=1 Tax=Variovorax sp. JS1663 TaxID=1851577 RepID=UPI000B342644|nr:histidine kinase dimerization/phospho-acceptor domain-containing protein [Variovorax sp. JS1663]OUM04360.1 hypothetical protein A8M77_01245 [Variovorax sp. JS1663]
MCGARHEAAIELRDQFIAVLGHDLRNPLATLSLIGELMARRTSEPDLAKTAQLIRSTTRRMGHLIGDVMDFTRARIDGKLDLSFGDIDDIEVALGDVVSDIGASIESDPAGHPRSRTEGPSRFHPPGRMEPGSSFASRHPQAAALWP